MSRTARTAVAFAGLLMFVSPAKAGSLADSVSQFSATQGQDGWFYGYSSGAFTGSNFTMMTQFATSEIDPPNDAWFVQEGTYWTQLTASGGHSNGTTTSGGRMPVEQWAVREWVSNFSGDITISGSLAKTDAGGGNGITGDIFVDGTEVYSQFIAPSDLIGVSYAFDVHVNVGSVVAFAIDPTDNNDLFDATKFTGIVTAAVPEPSTLVMLSFGLAGVLSYRWHRKLPNASVCDTASIPGH
jgi:hypothetical protein